MPPRKNELAHAVLETAALPPSYGDSTTGIAASSVGQVRIDPADLCHIRYQGSVDDARGHGPLEAGRAILASSRGLAQYAATVTAGGLVPSSILEAPEQMSPDQAATLRDDWVAQRAAHPGYPAVLSGGLKWTPTALTRIEASTRPEIARRMPIRMMVRISCRPEPAL